MLDKNGETDVASVLLIDAKNFGNFSRFINHSCEPNMCVIEVKNQEFLNFSDLSFFALKDIEPELQLTIDYGCDFWSVKKKDISCECGSTKCKYSNRNETVAS